MYDKKYTPYKTAYDKSHYKRVTLLYKPEDWLRLKDAAHARGVTVPQLVRTAIDQLLDNNG